VAASGIITTVAGNGSVGFAGDGGPATSALLNQPIGVTVDASGNLFIADSLNGRIRKVSAGIIATFAGGGTGGVGDGGPATSASLSLPYGVAVDASGNLFISDLLGNRIRKVSASGIITTMAGTGTCCFSSDGGAATSALLGQPTGVAVDASGNIFIADRVNNRIREVSASGIITTLAGNGTGGFSGDGGPATSAELYQPSGVAVNTSGNLFIADYVNDRIREVSVPASSGLPVAIPLPAAVTDVDVNLNTNQVYVGGNISNVVQNIVWIDGNTNSIVKSLGPGQNEHVNAATNKIYAADLYGGHILVYSGSDGSLLKTISTFGCPVETVVDTQLNHIWGAGQCGGGNDPAFLIDGNTDTLISGYIGSGGVMGSAMAVNPSNHAFYLSTGGVEKEVNSSTFAVTNAPFSAAVVASSPLAASMYGADATGKNVVVINYGTESVVTTLPVAQTGAIGVNPTRNRVYAVDLSVSPPVIKVFAGGNSLIGSNTLIGSIPLRSGDHPCCNMAVNSSSGTIYLPVVNSGSPFLLVIADTLTNTPVGAPGLTSLSPSTAVSGAGGFTVTVNGSGFVSGSVVQWNGAALTTTFVSTTQLTAAVPAGDIASVGVAQVTVTNPGGGTSNALPFTIQASVGNLSITSIAPNSATAGGGAFTLTVNGTGFSPSFNTLQGPVPGSVVQWNGTALPTSYISSTQLTAAVPAIDLASAGIALVTATNGAAASSNAQTFTIQPPPTQNGPVITSLSPPSVAPHGLGTGIGVAFLPLVVNGSGFVPASVVRWNGTDQQTTFVSATQLKALIADDEIPGSPTSVLVTVFNPAPGGGTSNTFSYPVDPSAAPVISSLSPSTATTGAAFQLTIYGWNFNGGTIVRWNGSDRPTTPFFDPHGQCCVLYAAISASDVAAAGTAQVTVFTPGAPSSNPVTFTIQAPSTNPAITSVTTAFAGPVIAQNTFIVIKGANLVPSNTPSSGTIWSTAPSFASGLMPTQLGGVSVTVNNKPAFVEFFCSAATASICPQDQLNILTPLDNTTGPVQVVVTSGGVSSPAFPVNMQAIAPSFLLFSTAGYIAATHANNIPVGATNLYPGLSTPAQAGETIILYAVGFGLPTTALVNGSATQSGPLPVLPVCQVGGTTAALAFAGLTSPGLYQLNLTIPATAANGDNAVSCTYNGATTPAGDLITVQSSTPVPTPLTLLDAVTSNQTGTPNNVCSLPPSITSFPTTAPGVFLYFDVNGAVPGDMETTTFYRPDGVVYFTDTSTVAAVGANGYTCVGYEIFIAGYPGASYPGTWTVSTTWNNAPKPLFSLNFNLVSSQPGQQFTLTVVATSTGTGSGSGTVSPSPVGTLCGTNCWSYAAGTVVTLTATPATGSTFAGWSGGCSGTGVTCAVTMNANLAVTATFNPPASASTLAIVPGQVIFGTVDQNGGMASNLVPYLLLATGGNVGPGGYTWTPPPGSLKAYPPAIVIQPVGVVDDVSPQSLPSGVFTMPVEVSDGTNAVTSQVTIDLSLVCNSSNGNTSKPCSSATVPTNVHIPYLPTGAIGSAYAASITTEGGTPPYRWTLGGGSLPPGISIDPAKGLLLGTPTAAGTFNFFVLTTDAAGLSTSSEIRAGVLAAQFTLVVN
jgi:uncharacterized protein (TIGR03437 family)